jgi:hypothetical protein
MALATLITLVLALVVVGLCLYLLETYVPMAAPIKVVIRALVAIFFVLYLLNVFGIYAGPVGIR